MFNLRSHLAIGKMTVLLAFVWILGGCRLYEPPRYDRLTFAPGAPQTRVLMIGDSLTYYNDLPGLLQQFSAAEKAPVYIEQITFPLASLKNHWKGNKAVERIRQGRFDYVILQDFSRKPVTDPQDCLLYFSKFDQEIKNSGAKTIVFQNWTRRDLEKDYPALVHTYGLIIDRTHAQFAPIGAAWKLCADRRSDIQLLLDDRHPTEAGSYLAACVLYRTLYHQPASALPAQLPGPKLPENVRMALRTIADRAATRPTP